jgi:hypothetical protein
MPKGKKCGRCGGNHKIGNPCKTVRSRVPAPASNAYTDAPTIVNESQDTASDGESLAPATNLQSDADDGGVQSGTTEVQPDAVADGTPATPPTPGDVEALDTTAPAPVSGGGKVGVVSAHVYTVGVGPDEIVGFTDQICILCDGKPSVWTDRELQELAYAFDHDETLHKLGYKTENGSLWVAVTVAKKTLPKIAMNYPTFKENLLKKFSFLKGFKIGNLFGKKKVSDAPANVPDGTKPE